MAAMHAWHSCYQENDMRNDLFLDTRLLAKGRIRRIQRPLGRRVECVSGSLWITQDGDPRDIVLAPGESFAFDHKGDALISALDDASFLLLESCAPAIAAAH
jgi:hypothetical protein